MSKSPVAQVRWRTLHDRECGREECRNRLSCQLDCGGISIEPPRPMRWIPPCTSTDPVSGEIGSAEFSSDKLSCRWPTAAQTHLVHRRVVRFLPRTQQLLLLSVPKIPPLQHKHRRGFTWTSVNTTPRRTPDSCHLLGGHRCKMLPVWIAVAIG